MDTKEELSAPELLEQIRIMLKDEFVATVRKKNDEIELKFPSGKTFTVTVWENKAY